MAGCCIINGFGKSTGLIQLKELGTIETPIVMTNTLSVGTALNAVVKYSMEQNPDIGGRAGTVNGIVTECNDGALNDIRGLYVTEEHVLEAIARAAGGFAEGAVGAGTGMSCLGVKGGIGSASRVIELDGKEHVLGALVLANFGCPGDLRIGEDWVGRRIERAWEAAHMSKDKGSVIIVLATDIPLSERQLSRVAKRAVIGLSRVGSYLGNGSGDISIAFTTANKVNHYSSQSILNYKMLHDGQLDDVFRAAAETVEESVISALYCAERTIGYNGRTSRGLREFLLD